MVKFDKKLFFSLLLWISVAGSIFAQEPDGYYAAAEGKSNAELKTALFGIINEHTAIEYYSSSTYFKKTDWNMQSEQYPNGYFWDMYSNIKRTVWSGLNREHSLPKSWFGIDGGKENTLPAGTDLHNLYPSDPTANTAKSNYPLGEVTGTPTFSNGVVKVGNNGFSGYSGIVFEPADRYKGDFARDYMYMVTCYEDFSTRWTSLGTKSMLIGGSTYPVFKTYAIDLLMKWHRADPVDDKEINRNNEVYKIQHNRNPFIDHPELAEFIWGNKKSDLWDLGGGRSTTISALKIKLDYSTNVLTVVFEGSENPLESVFFVRSVSGATLSSGSFPSEGTISIANLSNGAYLLTVYSGNQKRTTKFIVAH